jgi:tetratricopeptide (TPR) repeat protein
VRRLVLILITTLITCFAQSEQEAIRFADDKEAWLASDLETALNAILPLTESPDADRVTLFNAGYLYYLTRDYSKALSFLQRALKKDESYPYSYLFQARIYQQSGNTLGALTQLKRGLNYDSENYDLLIELGKAYRLLGENDLAEQTFTQLLEKYPDKVSPRVALSEIYRAQNRLSEAKNVLEENNALYPESTLLIEKSQLYRAMGDHEQAANYLIKLCQDYPNASWISAFRDTLQHVYNISDVKQSIKYTPYKYSIKPGESLDYIVKYGFVTLGWLKIRMEDALNLNGRTVYPIVFYIDSNPSFDFLISLHHVYESYIEAESMNSIRTRLHTKEDPIYMVRTYYFDYDNSIFQAQIIYHDGRFSMVQKDLPLRAQDGTSMLYFARGIVSNNSGGSTTVVIDEEYKYGHINFLDETEEVDVGDDEVQATKIFARAEFEGIAGMNGDAWGWFSLDGDYVPLMGKIKILLGSIVIKVDDDNTD